MRKRNKRTRIADKPRDSSYSVKISCSDCGMVRFVKPSDAHHVTRCKKHQKEHDKERRKLAMREYRAKLKKSTKRVA